MHDHSEPNLGKRHATLTQWVDEYGAGLYRRALFLCSSREAAEDIVQETFLAASQQLEHYAGKSTPKTWLHAILKNKIADHFRERYRNAPARPTSDDLENDFFTPDGMWRMEAVPEDWDHSSEHLLDNPDFSRVLEDCMGHLQPLWRDVVVSKYITSKKGPEICQELDISPTNFWQILHRAKMQLRQCLEHYWFKN